MTPPVNPGPLVEVRDLAKIFDVSPPWLNRLLERKPRRPTLKMQLPQLLLPERPLPWRAKRGKPVTGDVLKPF